MIISKTPFRISFVGGGSDLPAFYLKNYGAVVSTTINKGVYITVHRSFDRTNTIKYSKIEKVKDVNEIINTRVRAAMKKTGVLKGVEITSISDVPTGTGLGGSSSFTVGLLNSLYSYREKMASKEKLAREACEVELKMLQEPIGKQDQYAAAYGGLNFIKFNEDETVTVQPIICSRNTLRELDKNMLLFYTGNSRSASKILAKQSKNLMNRKKFENLKKMRDFAPVMRDFLKNNDLTSFAELLHKNWLLKKSLHKHISDNFIDVLYKRALENGAIGGKILGAGGGGFLLLYCEEEKQDRLRNNLGLEEMYFELDKEGSKVIFYE